MAKCPCGYSTLDPSDERVSSPYIHKPLPAKSFRVFVLSPGDSHDTVSGHLENQELGETDTLYSALSYTWVRPHTLDQIQSQLADDLDPDSNSTHDGLFAWEKQRMEHCIVVSETKSLQVTCNLYSALVRVRSPYENVRLYADALCIDQGTSASCLCERAQQIMLMGDIFRNATVVFADLGDYDDRAADSLDFLEPLANVDDNAWDEPKADRRGYNALIPREILETVSTETWMSFLALCTRRYWRRLWVLEEVILARRAIFYVGRRTIERSRLLKGLKRMWNYLNSGDVLEGNLKIDLDLRARLNAECRHACISMEGLTGYLATYPSYLENGLPIIQILALTDKFETTALHDQLYGLLGMAWTPDQEAITVDYTKPYADLLIQFSRNVMQTFSMKYVLHQIPWRQIGDLPSWVLDPRVKSIEDTLDSSVFYGDTSNAFSASGPLTASVSFSENGRKLQIQAIHIGEVTAATDPYPSFFESSTGPFWNLAVKWFIQAKELCLNSRRNVEDTKSGSFDDFWDTVTAGRCLLLRDFGEMLANMDACIVAFNHWIEKNAAFVRSEETMQATFTQEVSQVYNYATTVCHDRRIALTANGHTCLIPKSARCGDEIVILLGSPIPFVVRPCWTTNSPMIEETPPKSYTLVGSAYVTGAMDGQLASGPSRKDPESIWLL